MDLLWPKPPLTCSSHQTSTPGPLSLVVAACVKDARPSRWLAPLERPRWPQQRPRVAPPAKPSLSAVELVELAGGEPPRVQQRGVRGRASLREESASALFDFNRRPTLNSKFLPSLSLRRRPLFG